MRLFATLLSFWVASSLDAALNDCADEFDSTALMQTRLAALARDRNPDSDATWETKLIRDASFGQTQAHANTSGDIIEATVREMTATVDDIERKARQAPTGSWDENQATLADFRTTIQQQLQVFLESESSQDQEEFNTRKQQHVSCNADQRWQPGGDVANAAAEVARWRTKHQACRASQRAWLTYKTTAIASSSCASAADIPTEHEVYAEHVTLAALVTAAQSQASTYDLTDPAGKRACDLDQTQFEDHYCTWRSAHYYACASAQDCASQTGLSALADAMRTRAENRRNLARTLAILSCRVGHLLSSMDNDATTEVSDFNTTDNCSNIGVNQSLFVLDLAIPSLPACNDHLAPGTTTSTLGGPSLVDAAVCQAFRDANYVASQGFEVASHVIPTQCQATCPAISYIPWVLPPECVNEPEDCTFYNHHRDACGSYDTATFVAGDSCCACGGGASAGGGGISNGGWTLVAVLQGLRDMSQDILGTEAHGTLPDPNSKLSDSEINALNFNILKFEPENEDYETHYFNFADREFGSLTDVPGCTEYALSEEAAIAHEWQTDSCCYYNVCNFGRGHCSGTVKASYAFVSGGSACANNNGNNRWGQGIVGTGGVVTSGNVRIYVNAR